MIEIDWEKTLYAKPDQLQNVSTSSLVQRQHATLHVCQ